MSSGCKGCEPKTAVMKSDGFRMDKVVVQKVLRDCKKSFKKNNDNLVFLWYTIYKCVWRIVGLVFNFCLFIPMPS